MERPPRIAIALLAACVLAYEVLLTRLLGIVLWHHYAYMIISAAMLGYGASGTALTLLQQTFSRHVAMLYVAAACALAASMPAAFWLAQQVPFNPLALLWEPSQLLLLLALYLLLMLPFFCGGLCIGMVFAQFGQQASRVYAFDILGAGLGSLGVIAALFLASPGKILVLLPALALLGAACAVVELRLQPRWLAVVLAGSAALAAALPDVTLHLSPYKDLRQALNISGARVIEQRSSPLGLISVVENTRIPLRHAPGMSLNALDEPPSQLAVYIDGDGPAALTRFDGDRTRLAFLGQLTSALPYPLLAAEGTNRPRVLVLGAGPGSEVLQALYHGSTAIDAVELDRKVIELVQQRFREYSGDLYLRPEVHVYAAEARGFVNRTSQQYDLIQVALLDSFGTSAAGLYGLSENYLYTVEAMQAYLQRLRPGGMLAITRWLTLPPRDSLKLFATAIAALEHQGISQPGLRLALVRGWKTVTLLVKNGDFSAAEMNALREFCRTRSFDPDYYPGSGSEESNRYNQLAQPYFHEAALSLLGPQRQQFIERYKFFIEPASDDRPQFFRSFKWNALEELVALRSHGGLALLDWSYPLLVATLLQALVASFVLILAPLAVSRCRCSLPPPAAALYFLAIGLAFMFIEIAFIQKFQLFLAHPLYAVAVVLCAFLLFAAAGSRLAGRWLDAGREKTVQGVKWIVIALCAISLCYLAVLPSLSAKLAAWPDAAKIAVAIVLIAPLAMCMGVPFPAGIRRLAQTSAGAIPWAWAINGCAAVVGAVLAALLAIHLGFVAVILLALGGYAASYAALCKFA